MKRSIGLGVRWNLSNWVVRDQDFLNYISIRLYHDTQAGYSLRYIFTDKPDKTPTIAIFRQDEQLPPDNNKKIRML
jgi:hypothetical protein